MKKIIFLLFLFNLQPLYAAFEYRFYGYKSNSLGDIVSVVKQTSFLGNPAIFVNEENFLNFGTVDIFGLGLIRGYKIGTLFSLKNSFKMGLNYQYLGNTSKVDFLNYREEIFSVIFSKRLFDGFSIGLNLNSGISEIEKQGSFFGMDLGVLYEFRNFKVGFYSENINQPQVNWQTGTTEKLKRINKIGLSYGIFPVIIYLEKDSVLRAGFECDIRNFEFYFGYFEDSYPSFNFGLSFLIFKNVEFNYSIKINEKLGNTQIFNINLML